jgi:predicted O-methyltransferase YrrM
VNISLEELRSLSDNLHNVPDNRPAWLREMPYAMETLSHYYRLIWELVKQKKPAYSLEIGIDKGGSTLTLAAAHPAGSVVSVDISKDACENARRIAEAHGLRNLVVANDDSLRNIKLLRTIGKKADLLFLDGRHDFEHCYAEYIEYRPFMQQGGIILFDDIHESRQMETAWEYVVDPKVELPRAHHSGFGACKVDHSIVCPTLSSIVDQAYEKFR